MSSYKRGPERELAVHFRHERGQENPAISEEEEAPVWNVTMLAYSLRLPASKIVTNKGLLLIDSIYSSLWQ